MINNFIEDYLIISSIRKSIMSIIIPTKELVLDFKSDLDTTDYLVPDIDKLFDRLLTTLCVRNKARQSLEIEKKRFIEIIKSIEPSSAEQVGKSVFDIGTRLFHLLDTHNAYESGFLIYQKDKWVGSDLVLRKLTKDELPDIN